MVAVILAAGVGSRLGRPLPKSLSFLPDGERIMGRQIRFFKESGIKRIYIVVGFKKSLIMEEYPDVFYVYNPIYYISNTSKSLFYGLKDLEDDVIWVNGDVIFDKSIIEMIIKEKGNVVAVNNLKCGKEEVKYRTNREGEIESISKNIEDGEGEALGINRISKKSLPDFLKALYECDNNDYFEKGIEKIIDKGITVKPLNVSVYRCIEVDFEEDYRKALEIFK